VEYILAQRQVMRAAGFLGAGLVWPLGATVILFVVHLFEW
jgi:hypothetical protein